MRREDKRPRLSDLRESVAIEQDADVVTLVHRDDSLGEEEQQGSGAEIIIAKQLLLTRQSLPFSRNIPTLVTFRMWQFRISHL